MQEFKTLFGQIFKLKRKYVYSAIFFEIIATIVLSILMIFQNAASPAQTPLIASSASFFMIDLYLLFTIAKQNNQILMSQTWRLVPVSSTKLFFSSILTSIVSFLYLWLLQLVWGIFTFIPFWIDVSTTNKNFYFSGIDFSSLFNLSERQWRILIEVMIQMLLILFLFAVFIFVLSIMVRTFSEVISDFVPTSKEKITRGITSAALIVVIIYILQYVGQGLAVLRTSLFSSRIDVNGWEIIISLLIGDVIVSMADLWLLDRYVEGK